MRLGKRTQLYLSEQQWRDLEEEARARGVSAAELVRNALDAFLTPKEPFGAVVKAVAGAWAALPQGGAEYVARLRAEWADRPGG